MTDSKQAITNLWNKISTLIDHKLSSAKYDKTFQATIWGKNPDGTYLINYKNQKYSVYNALGTELELGQLVWIKIPSGVFRHMHICGLAKRK